MELATYVQPQELQIDINDKLDLRNKGLYIADLELEEATAQMELMRTRVDPLLQIGSILLEGFQLVWIVQQALNVMTIHILIVQKDFITSRQLNFVQLVL